MTEKKKIAEAAEKCRQDWCEKIRPLTDEKTYQKNKDSVGRAVVPFAFEAGVRYGIELERERAAEEKAKVLDKALRSMDIDPLICAECGHAVLTGDICVSLGLKGQVRKIVCSLCTME